MLWQYVTAFSQPQQRHCWSCNTLSGSRCGGFLRSFDLQRQSKGHKSRNLPTTAVAVLIRTKTKTKAHSDDVGANVRDTTTYQNLLQWQFKQNLCVHCRKQSFFHCIYCCCVRHPLSLFAHQRFELCIGSCILHHRACNAGCNSITNSAKCNICVAACLRLQCL